PAHLESARIRASAVRMHTARPSAAPADARQSLRVHRMKNSTAVSAADGDAVRQLPTPRVRIEPTVFVAIDPDADSRAARDAGAGELRVGSRRKAGELRQRQRRVIAAVGPEHAGLIDEPAPAPFGDDVALALPRTREEQLNPRLRHDPVVGG